MRFFKRGFNSLSRDHFYFHPWLFLRALGASVRGKKTSLVTVPFDPTEESHGGTESQRLQKGCNQPKDSKTSQAIHLRSIPGFSSVPLVPP
jgi:hypothetical protein